MKNFFFFFLGNFPLYFIYLFILLKANYFAILNWFCHTSAWICHGCTSVPRPEPPSHLLPHPFPLGHPSTSAPNTLYHALNLDWRFVSHMIFYMFQCHSPKSSHPHPLPQSPKDCSIHLCLFCCLAYRVIITIFLNSIYMRSVQFSWSVVSNSLRPRGLQHTRLSCPSPTPSVYQTHAHRVDDAIQPSHPVLSPSPPALNPSQHQGLFQWVNLSHEVAKVLEFQPQHQSFQWTPRTGLL